MATDEYGYDWGTDLNTGYGYDDMSGQGWYNDPYGFNMDIGGLDSSLQDIGIQYIGDDGGVMLSDGQYIPANAPDSVWQQLTSALTSRGQGGQGNSILDRLVGAGGSALAAYLGAGDLAGANRSAADLIKAQDARNQQALQPYIGAGVNALNRLQGMAGQQTPGFNYDPNKFLSSPTFQALYKSGISPVASTAAAQGMYGSGNMANALMERGQQIAAQYMPQDWQIQQQNYLNSLQANNQDYARTAGLASTGLEALGRGTSLGSNAAQLMAGYGVNTGAATAQQKMAPITYATNALLG